MCGINMLRENNRAKAAGNVWETTSSCDLLQATLDIYRGMKRDK